LVSSAIDRFGAGRELKIRDQVRKEHQVSLRTWATFFAEEDKGVARLLEYIADPKSSVGAALLEWANAKEQAFGTLEEEYLVGRTEFDPVGEYRSGETEKELVEWFRSNWSDPFTVYKVRKFVEKVRFYPEEKVEDVQS
jgi:hypothetical protein